MTTPQVSQDAGREESSMTPTGASSATHRDTLSRRRRAVLADPVERFARVVEIRAAEDSVNELFAAGAIHGSTHLAQGQEALAVGLASVTRPDDVMTATYRGHALALA